MTQFFMDEALFASFQSGAEKAFSAIFEMYYPRLVIYTYRLTETEAEAKEIASDVLARTFQRYGIYTTPAHLNNYLYLSARNASIDYLRRQSSRQRKYDEYVAAQPDELALDETELFNIELDSALLDNLYRAIDLLPDKSRQVIQYLYIEQLSYRDAAERLGTTVKNIENLRAYALKKLKSELGGSVSISLLTLLLSHHLHSLA